MVYLCGHNIARQHRWADCHILRSRYFNANLKRIWPGSAKYISDPGQTPKQWSHSVFTEVQKSLHWLVLANVSFSSTHVFRELHYSNHILLLQDVKAYGSSDKSSCFPFPIISAKRELAVELGMLDPAEVDKDGLPLTARSVSFAVTTRTSNFAASANSACISTVASWFCSTDVIFTPAGINTQCNIMAQALRKRIAEDNRNNC